jgi:hypothetical protein
MSLVSDVITDIRVEINDTGSTRFSDDTTSILPIVKQAIRRANRICQRAGLHFAKKSGALTCTASQAYVTMPSDLDIPIGLWRDDTHTKIEQKTESEWEQIVSAGELACWFLDLTNSRILLTGTPASAVALTIWYYPTVDPSAYTTASTMPWGGRLDDIIARYVALRLQNIDEMDVTMDEKILQDMEQSIISTYQPQSPIMVAGAGWL